MRRIVLNIFAMVVLGVPLRGQSAPVTRIEIRKVATLSDGDGRGFGRAPIFIVPARAGRYVGVAVNELPIVVDSMGRLVKGLGGRGEGPGEFGYTMRIRLGSGDSVFVMDNQRISVMGSDLTFVRSVLPPGGFAIDMLPVAEGFVMSIPTPRPGQHQSLFQIVDATGKTVRTFGDDTVVPRSTGSYLLGPTDAGAFWTVKFGTHRLERWTTAGQRTAVIDTQPAWWVEAPQFRSSTRQFREVAGRLWVLSSVPVPNAAERMRADVAALGVGRGEIDARRVPSEKYSTGHLEVYDVATKRLLGDVAIPSYVVAILDDSHFMTYTTDANDLAHLEIWEMKLRP